MFFFFFIHPVHSQKTNKHLRIGIEMGGKLRLDSKRKKDNIVSLLTEEWMLFIQPWNVKILKIHLLSLECFYLLLPSFYFSFSSSSFSYFSSPNFLFLLYLSFSLLHLHLFLFLILLLYSSSSTSSSSFSSCPSHSFMSTSLCFASSTSAGLELFVPTNFGRRGAQPRFMRTIKFLL